MLIVSELRYINRQDSLVEWINARHFADVTVYKYRELQDFSIISNAHRDLQDVTVLYVGRDAEVRFFDRDVDLLLQVPSDLAGSKPQSSRTSSPILCTNSQED